MAFQAKDIQEILRIPKIRYEYLARQIGIVPEIEEAAGTGTAHKFSFRNLMQFAIAERCSLTGLSMKQIKFFMDLLHQHKGTVFSDQPDLEFEAWFYGIPGGGMFVLEGENREVFLYKVSGVEFNQTLSDYYSALNQLEKSPDKFEALRKAVKNERVSLTECLEPSGRVHSHQRRPN